jgi:hypothetical protein
MAWDRFAQSAHTWSYNQKSVVELQPKVGRLELPLPPVLKYYGREQSHLTEIPTTFKDANASQDKEKRKVAMDMEMKSLQEKDVRDLVELSPGRKIVGSKWVFKKKAGADSTVERYKARLVAQGYTQKYGMDYDETFCPVVRQESLRVLITLSVKSGLKQYQVDVTTAFLNGMLKEEDFMKQPEGFEIQGKEHLFCRLKKSIYGQQSLLLECSP